MSPGPLPLSETGQKNSQESAHRCTHHKDLYSDVMRTHGWIICKRGAVSGRIYVVVFLCSLHPMRCHIGCPVLSVMKCSDLCATFLPREAHQGPSREQMMQDPLPSMYEFQTSRREEGVQHKAYWLHSLGIVNLHQLTMYWGPSFQMQAKGQWFKQVLLQIAVSGLLW